jgi:hypothetical protein
VTELHVEPLPGGFHVDVRAGGEAELRAALELVGKQGRWVVGCRVSGRRLLMRWAPVDSAGAIDFPMAAAQAAEFALGWLEGVDYGSAAPLQGASARGWHLYCASRGSEALATIEPVWATQAAARAMNQHNDGERHG